MSDFALDSLLWMLTNESIEMSRLKISAEEGNDYRPRGEGQRMPFSPENELRSMPSGIMPGSWDAESPSTTKTHGDHEEDIEARKDENPQVRLAEVILQRLSELNEMEKGRRGEGKQAHEGSHGHGAQVELPHIQSPAPPQDYDALVEQIQDWVQKLMNPWLEDCGDDAHAFLTHAKRRIVDADRFKRILREYPDLMNGLNFSGQGHRLIRDFEIS
ncbi:hypothetical protein FPCIR_162 [Fusarium pseudocircinatum]|uniref:Uncharacterized protein n=1 Tax=Fusarium pseudocircinatum TaxID=56676 RepID=A0A8H5V0I3_9HYPO|nr:hypothetical protein FPCIR_162 [Fusarium pseudocircinatum]